MNRNPAIYIMTNRPFGTLYVGVTSNLIKRVWEHRESKVNGFSCEYGLHRLVWFEMHATMIDAIAREKQVKRWNRAWKIRLILERNRDWRDLWPDIVGAHVTSKDSNGSPASRDDD